MKFTSRIITNQTNDLFDADFSEGEIILIDKPSGPTSFQVVNKVRKITGVKKVGHSGTLDPLASGLVIVCTGKKTKEMDRFINLDKTYTGIIRLGLSSPSMDTETECSEYPLPEDLDERKILNAREKFLGEIEQTPPMYSAVKIKGKKLYNLARKGKSVERKPRKVFISKFDIEKVDLPDIYFHITCSKGTYIRAIADDLGKELNCGGVLYKLRREKIGEFNVKNALTIEQLTARILSSDKFFH
ncbi:MAG: tRNA pseudouridine(55) synthase TruB [Ignavibacteriaceae bacterium]|jgi:tRNA pseudouridine55 synthase|nr:tRNA pseudouridine(55) synthase TruB [Ignavibacteriaceae bacterium]MCW8816468.1 tRNA pseudouridine(55) synthase TruB [Ignavibacteriaceae bacterium]